MHLKDTCNSANIMIVALYVNQTKCIWSLMCFMFSVVQFVFCQHINVYTVFLVYFNVYPLRT